MKTYKHNTYKHTVTAEDHETTKQRILAESGWYLVPEVKTEEPLAYVVNTDSASVAVVDVGKPKATKKQ